MVSAIDQRIEFNSALTKYHQARRRIARATDERRRDAAVQRLDNAIDLLLQARSPDVGAFGTKLHILEQEYGLHAQPRHVAAIYADVALLAAIYAGAILQGWPGG